MVYDVGCGSGLYWGEAMKASKQIEQYLDESTLERFWKFVEQGEGCWEWSGSLQSGYGVLTVRNGYQCRAHRVMWAHKHGDPGKMLVLHTCDNSKCVNPDHLYLGTHKDNRMDMVNRGRVKGKLSEDVVLAIVARLDDGDTQREIAEDFGVVESTVSLINSGGRHNKITGRAEGYESPERCETRVDYQGGVK